MIKNRGEQFLHQKDNKLHTSQPVEHEKERKKIKDEEVSLKPSNKISDWMDVLEQTHISHREKDPRVLERIKKHYHQEYITVDTDNIPQGYWNNNARIMIEQGYGGDLEQAGVQKETHTDKKEKQITDYIFPEQMKKQELEVIINNQKRSLDLWVDYLTSADSDSYPTWLKYWVFNSVVKMGKFQKLETSDEDETNIKARFQKRTKDTTSSFPILNHRALEKTMNIILKRVEEKAKPKDKRETTNESIRLTNQEYQQLVSTEKFANLYAQFLLELPEYSTEGLQETRGEWKLFKQGSDPEELVKTIQNYPLEWCTANLDTARTQLQGGDFHIYYSINEDGIPEIPRLAIRMEEKDKIAEPPRGIAPNQNLDPYISPILAKKMEEFGTEGEKYEKKNQDMEQLTAIDRKTKKGQQLDKDDLIFLYEIDQPIQGFGYQKDPRIEELHQARDPKIDAPIVFECEPDQIAYNQNEVIENTKAYIGPLFPNIFKIIKNIEHIYTEFPEGKIRRHSVEIGGQSKEELKQTLKKGGFRMTRLWGPVPRLQPGLSSGQLLW